MDRQAFIAWVKTERDDHWRRSAFATPGLLGH